MALERSRLRMPSACRSWEGPLPRARLFAVEPFPSCVIRLSCIVPPSSRNSMCNKGQRSRLFQRAALPGVTPFCTGIFKPEAGSRTARKPAKRIIFGSCKRVGTRMERCRGLSSCALSATRTCKSAERIVFSNCESAAEWDIAKTRHPFLLTWRNWCLRRRAAARNRRSRRCPGARRRRGG